MHRSKIMLVAVGIVLGLGVQTPLRSETKKPEAPKAAPHMTPPPMMNPGGGMWKERLGLTEEQQTKLTNAMKDRDTNIRALFDKQREATQKLRELVDKKGGDAEVEASLNDLTKSQKAIEEARQKYQDDLGTFLSPTQRAKLLVGGMPPMMRGTDNRPNPNFPPQAKPAAPPAGKPTTTK